MERLVTLHIRYVRTIYTTKIFRIFLPKKKKKRKIERTNERISSEIGRKRTQCERNNIIVLVNKIISFRQCMTSNQRALLTIILEARNGQVERAINEGNTRKEVWKRVFA